MRITIVLALIAAAILGCGSAPEGPDGPGGPSGPDGATYAMVPQGDPLEVLPGEHISFSVTKTLGGETTRVADVAWATTPGLGEIDAAGQFVATTEAPSDNGVTGTVSASAQGWEGSVDVEVRLRAEGVSHLTIVVPSGVDLSAVLPGQEIAFAVEGTDSFGNRGVGARLAVPATWSCDAVIGSVDEAGLFTARQVPSTASVSGSVRARYTSEAGAPSAVQPLTVVFPPDLSVEQDVLDFGDEAITLPITITNLGSQALTWEVSEDLPWLTASPASGSGDATVNVVVTRTDLDAGTYTGTVAVISNGGTASVDVTMRITTAEIIVSSDGGRTR